MGFPELMREISANEIRNNCTENYGKPSAVDHTASIPRTMKTPPRWSADFNPREALKMPYHEKITKWLDSLPWIFEEDPSAARGSHPVSRWSIPSSGELLTLPDTADWIDMQAQEITRLTTAIYFHNGEVAVRPLAAERYCENTAYELGSLAQNS